MTVAELARRGDLGLGTFDALDGELIAVDGVVYRAAWTAPSRRPPRIAAARSQSSPGSPRAEREVGALDFDALLEVLDRDVPRSGVCAAVRLDGHFDHVRLRSVPAQRPPWRTLDEVLAEQRTFEASDVDGTVVGFRFLPGAAGLDFPASICISSEPIAASAATCSAAGHARSAPGSTSTPTSTSSSRPACSCRPATAGSRASRDSNAISRPTRSERRARRPRRPWPGTPPGSGAPSRSRGARSRWRPAAARRARERPGAASRCARRAHARP